MCRSCVAELYAIAEGLEASTITVPDELRPLLDRITAFRDLPECGTGGPLHIVTDDANVENEHIEWCLANEGSDEPLHEYEPQVWAVVSAAPLPFPVPEAVLDEHELLLATCAPRLGWWAECCCGWIGGGCLTEARALASHEAHQRRQVGS